MTNFPLYLIQLWWQFFPNACLWRRSLCSNLAGIDSEKLSRATFICQYGLLCCMALLSFRLFCKNLGNLQEFFGQMDYRPPVKKLPVRLCFLMDVNFRKDDLKECNTIDVMCWKWLSYCVNCILQLATKLAETLCRLQTRENNCFPSPTPPSNVHTMLCNCMFDVPMYETPDPFLFFLE